MIAEVNKLIGNTILKSGGIYLPDIGSLSIVTLPPSIDKNGGGTSAPIRKVEMSIKRQDRSIIEIISERGNCTPQQATQIYGKWREVVKISDTKLLIQEVGEIKDNVFTATATFDGRLNPVIIQQIENKSKPKDESKPKKVDINDNDIKKRDEGVTAWEKRKRERAKQKPQSKSGSTKWITLSIITVGIAAGAFALLNREHTTAHTHEATITDAIQQTPPTTEEVETEEVTTEELSDQGGQIDESQSIELKNTVDTLATPIQESQPISTLTAMTPDEILEARFNAGRDHLDRRYKVVYGAYSTPKNVAKAIATAEQRTNGEVSCTVYQHGKSYIVSLYDAYSKEEAMEFIDRYKDIVKEPIWLHER